MSSYNPYSQYNKNDLMKVLPSSNSNTGIFRSLLRSITDWGMKYDDMVLKNQFTFGQYETEPAKNNPYNLYDIFSRRVMAEKLSKHSLASLNPSYEQKRKLLREYSVKDEIRDFVIDVCNEAIIYEQNSTKFCRLEELPDKYDKRIKDRAHEVFEEVYEMLKFNEQNIAWYKFREFIVDGYLSYEIVFDDRGRKIINIPSVDPITLTFGAMNIQNRMQRIWFQNINRTSSVNYNIKDNDNVTILLDSQIIYISYSSALEWSEVSYVEPLIRPYNLLKMLEKMKLMWQLRNALSYRKITIPVTGLSKSQAMEVVGQAIADYKDDVQFDDEMGQIKIDGELKIPFSKEFWFPSGEGGTPTVENISNEGPDLAEDKLLNWFRNNLKRASHTPFKRSDYVSGGGNVYQNNTDATREELNFTLLINRFRNIFKEIILKPVYIQMCLEFPELKDDKEFKRSLNIAYNSNNYYEYTKKINQYSFASQLASTLMGINKEDGKPYFHQEFILRKIYGFTEDELEENKRWFEKDKANKPSKEAIESATEDLGPIQPVPDYLNDTNSESNDTGSDFMSGNNESDGGDSSFENSSDDSSSTETGTETSEGNENEGTV